MEQLTQMIKAQVADELRREFDQRWESMSQQHNVEQEDDEEEVTEMELSYKCRVYVGEVPPRLVAIGRLYPRGSTMHTVQMSDDLARVVVEDIKDATSAIPVPTEEVKLVGEALGTFISWPKQLVKVVTTKKKVHSGQKSLVACAFSLEAHSQSKPKQNFSPIHELARVVGDLFQSPLAIPWDKIVFSVDNSDIPLYLHMNDVYEIIQGSQMLNIAVIQLWILYLNKYVAKRGDAYVYGFFEPQHIQKSGNKHMECQTYIQNWMGKSKKRIYMAPYINASHWQLVIICPLENIVVWLCSLHNTMPSAMRNILQSALNVYNMLGGKSTSSS